MTTFGATLARLRTAQRVSQSRLARMIEADHSYVSRLEAGQREPSREIVLALANALEATDGERAELMHAAGFATVEPTHEVLAFAGLPVAIQKDLLTIADMMTRGAAA